MEVKDDTQHSNDTMKFTERMISYSLDSVDRNENSSKTSQMIRESILGQEAIADEIPEIEMVECIPNGKKDIECFICGLLMTKIWSLRNHMAGHCNEDSFDLTNIKKSEIYKVLNPHGRNIDPRVIRNFIIEEVKAKRYSQFYVILNESGVELDISDSETDTEDNNKRRKVYKCELCKKTFDRRFKIMFHQKTFHASNEIDIECDFCMKKFVCMNMLIRHLKTKCEDDEKPISCVDRFKKYLLKVNLDQFANIALNRAQRKIQKLTSAPKVHACDVCHKSFTRSEHLTRHKAVHLPDELKFECPQCNRRFNRKDNMRSHMKIHTDGGEKSSEERVILCSYCGHSFSSKSNYVVHMRRHTGEKPYKCDVCGKGFPKSTDLNSHKITHTGEKNFHCTICKKSFARSAVLSRHMRMHGGSYNCTYCNKQFTKINDFNLHIRCHTSHNCTKCNKNFEPKSSLEEHVLCHQDGDNEKALNCNIKAKDSEDEFSGNTKLAQSRTDITIITNSDPLEIKNIDFKGSTFESIQNKTS